MIDPTLLLKIALLNLISQIIQRLYILLNMALLLGYSANASAIVFPDTEDAGSSPPFATLRATVIFYLTTRALRFILYVIYATWLPYFRSAILAAAIGIPISLLTASSCSKLLNQVFLSNPPSMCL
jgi:hypothetical protein